MVKEDAENGLLVRQCTFVHAAAYCHTRDATQRCQFGELTPCLLYQCVVACNLSINVITKRTKYVP